ncbi:MFS transporter [Sinomonas sp. ASV322]|uniref:MFS transporter n=1 Tax=Sinomonas sp. ASV322 TaxID=3041920 RepID=UPI0027DD4CF3|nr:MFS transporter [Sinomonas sp. ASV322]MDQ4504525.1 MFS transporter [Sinomonas sp. ASV322]
MRPPSPRRHPQRPTAEAESEPTRGAGTGGLARYVAAATLARTADGGAVVAVVLLAASSGSPGWLAGLLGASITAPHLLGPFVARRLDTARDGRSVIAAACLVHGATLAAAVLLYPVVWPGVTAVPLVASGVVGPLLTGGISSRLPAIAGPDRVSQRRAQGWDVATYGIGGTIGPTVVAVSAAWANAAVAGLILAAGTAVAAALVRLLPYGAPAAEAADVPRPGTTLGLMLRSGPLRRTLYLTVVVALSVAALPVTAVASTGLLHVVPAAAAALTAAYGLGSLAGSAAVMIWPLRGQADELTTRLALCVAAALAAAALAPGFAFAVAAYAAAGILNSCFFASTLAARSEYSPAEARAQVFVWVGALKITAGSAGTALAGTITATAPHAALTLAVVLTAASAVASLIDRRLRRGARARIWRRAPARRAPARFFRREHHVSPRRAAVRVIGKLQPGRSAAGHR